ncbi:ROK family protein [Flavitalea sp.]|nr:ROK family protein [Flavitalea sp.]
MEQIKESGVALGADIGGSHITAALVDINNKHLSERSLCRHAIKPNAGVDELLQGWADCIAKALGSASVEKICLAMPGPFRYDEGICLIRDQNKYPGLYGVNVSQRLSAALGLDLSAIYLHNDAACFLQGEVFSGSITGIKRAIGITLGTGLGTAIYKNGMAESADLWNMPFKDSIAEDFISSRWFTRKYYELRGKSIDGVKELVNLAHTEERIRQIFEEFGTNLAEFVNCFIELEDPEAVVIGGNISHAFPFFSEKLLKQVRNVNPRVRIYKSAQAENAALIGAVSSWYNSNKRSLAD